MSRQGTAWSVKGVDQATRDIARRASQAAGLTIGEWIDQAIRADAEARGDAGQAAAEQPAGRHGPAATVPAATTGRVSLATVDALAARLDAADARLDSAMRPIAYALQDIAGRLVALERRAADPALPAAAAAGPLRPERDRPELALPEPALPEPAVHRRQAPAPAPEHPGHGAFAPEADAPRHAVPEHPAVERPVAGDVAGSGPDDRSPPIARALPDAPPADWEPIVWFRRSELARAAEAMRVAGVRPEQPEPDAPPAEQSWADEPAADEPAADEPAAEAAVPEPPPLLDTEYDAIRFDEPVAPVAADRPVVHQPAADRRPAPRPDPVPPTGDLPTETSFHGEVPDWLTRQPAPEAREPATPELATPEPATPELVSREPTPAAAAMPPAGPGPESDSTPEPWMPAAPRPVDPGARAGLRRAPTRRARHWVRAAAAVALLAGATAAWWYATGGGLPTPESARQRLAQTIAGLRSGAEAGYRTASAEVDRLLERLFPGPAGPPPVAEAPPPETPAATVPDQTATDQETPDPPVPVAPEAGVTAAEPGPPEPAPAEPAPAEPSAPATELAAPAAPPAAPSSAPPAPSRPRAELPPSRPAAAPETPPGTVAAAAPPSAVPPSAVPPSAVSPTAPPPAPPLPRGAAPADRQVAALPPAGAPAAPAMGEPDAATLLADARGGDPRAQYVLATRLASAAQPDYPQAANWFREAAIQGVPNAQYNLGVLYERGLGVPQDDTRALLWYHSAAEQGHPLAQYNLGVLYSAGRGIPLSYAEAARWFRRAAEQDVPAAVFNLSVLTEGGLGVQRDPAEAEQLLRRAAELGHPAAGARLKGGGPSSDAATLDETASTVTDGVVAEDVVAIQRSLARLGLYHGPVDGINGPRTREAIARYQQLEGLPVTGLPSSSLRLRLSPPEPSG